MKDFFKYKNRIPPEKGCLLVSEPYLPDPNFERTVILLCEHNDEGSFGFILNKLSNLSFGEIIEEAKAFTADIFIGGPVQQDTLHFIHRNPQDFKSAVEIAENLYWGGDFDKLLTLIDTRQIQQEDFRFFVGYSGWGDGQLQNEIEENSWIVANPINGNILFDSETDNLWRLILKGMGGKYEMFSNYPVDPRLN